MKVQSNGLSFLPKLKSEHIELTSFSRMRVDLAIQVLILYMLSQPDVSLQVLNKSVAECFAYYGDPETSKTEIFVQLFDQFFDCLNVRSLSEWRLKGKPNLKPSTTDEQFKVWLIMTTWNSNIFNFNSG